MGCMGWDSRHVWGEAHGHGRRRGAPCYSGGVHLAIRVLCKVELDKVPEVQGLPRHGVPLVFHDVGHRVDDVHDGAVLRAHRLLERGEGDGAAVEGEALEGDLGAVLVAAPLRAPLRGGAIATVLR